MRPSRIFINTGVGGGGPTTHTGTGALTTPSTTLSGSGTVTKTGTGALTTSVVVLSGAGTVTKTGSGSLTIAAVTLSGSGVVGNAVVGTGALTTPATTLSGSGEVTKVGSGALTVGAVTLSGSGAITRIGTGALTTASATLSGSGTGGDATTITVEGIVGGANLSSLSYCVFDGADIGTASIIKQGSAAEETDAAGDLVIDITSLGVSIGTTLTIIITNYTTSPTDLNRGAVCYADAA